MNLLPLLELGCIPWRDTQTDAKPELTRLPFFGKRDCCHLEDEHQSENPIPGKLRQLCECMLLRFKISGEMVHRHKAFSFLNSTQATRIKTEI